MAKIAIEHKHSEVFKIFRRNSTPQDRIDQMLELDPIDVHDCIVDLMELYKEVEHSADEGESLNYHKLNKLLEVDA